MASYYYLMSSLPMLRSDGEMPFPYSTFLEMCASSVKPAVYSRLQALTVDSSEGALLSAWSKFYATLADELAYQRNTRLGKTDSDSHDRDSDTTRIVTTVMNEKNPLEAEKLLLALEFEKLDELIRMHYFDASALIGYALKLKLLERKTIFNHTSGKAEFGRLLSCMNERIQNIGLETKWNT